jgi:hypothetical protein
MEDINQCGVDIIAKYELENEAKYINGVIQDPTFIETMKYGNYSEIRESIVNASSKIIDRLG